MSWSCPTSVTRPNEQRVVHLGSVYRYVPSGLHTKLSTDIDSHPLRRSSDDAVGTGSKTTSHTRLGVSLIRHTTIRSEEPRRSEEASRPAPGAIGFATPIRRACMASIRCRIAICAGVRPGGPLAAGAGASSCETRAKRSMHGLQADVRMCASRGNGTCIGHRTALVVVNERCYGRSCGGSRVASTMEGAWSLRRGRPLGQGTRGRRRLCRPVCGIFVVRDQPQIQPVSKDLDQRLCM